jgi:hypothetical protein
LTTIEEESNGHGVRGKDDSLIIFQNVKEMKTEIFFVILSSFLMLC